MIPTLLLASLAASVAAAPLPVTPIAHPPRIDGRLDDAVWSRGPWLSGLHVPGENKPAALQVYFKLATDRRHFYVAARLQEPALDELHAATAPDVRDAPLWREDCLEVFLDCGTGGDEYYHFVVNPRGALYDAWHRRGQTTAAGLWNGRVRAAAARGAGEWTVELAIRLKDLNCGPGPWRINIARERYASGRQELFLLAPGPEFHAVGAFPEIAVPDMPSRPWMWTVKTPYDARVFRDGAELVFEATTYVRNLTGLFRFFTLRPTVISRDGKSADGQPVPAGLDDRQGASYSFRVTNPPLGKVRLRLQLVSRRDPRRVYAVRTWPLELSYTPIRVVLLRPRYRNSIFSSQSLETVAARVQLNVDSSLLARARMSVRLRRVVDGKPGPVVAAKDIRDLKRRFTVELPAPPEPGDYVLEFELVGAADRLPGEPSARVPLRKLPPARDEWYVGEANVLYHNGKPFMPFGWFSLPETAFATARADGYTALQSYGSVWWSEEKLLAWLDRVHQAGLVAIFYPYPNPRWFERGRAGQPLTPEEREALRQRVRAVKDHPAVLGYYLCDEPELVPWLPLRLRQIYETIRDEDPYHPCIVLNDTVPGIFKYADGGDILMPDPYPCFVEGGLAQQPIGKVATFIRAVNQATAGLKPAWVTPQAFNYADYGKPHNRPPNFTELRNMLYQAVVYGAKGFLWFTWAASQNYPDIGLGIPYLAKEIADLRDAVLASDAPGEVKKRCPEPDELHVSVRRVAEHWFIFAVNTATEPQDVVLDLSDFRGLPPRLWVIGENREVAVVAGKLSDRFETYATHLYTSDPRLADREPLTALLERIRRADAARRRPGNLAFEANGTAVEYSSKSRYGSTPARVVDGVRGGMQWRDGTPGRFPDWLVLRWPKPVRIARVVVFTDTVAAAELQVPARPGTSPEGSDDAAWKTVARSQAAGGDRLTFTFAPVRTRAIRLLITAARQGQAFVTVREIEAYER